MPLNDHIDSFIQQAKALLPDDSFSTEVEKNLRVLAQSAFSKLDMVTKDEFDAQVAVLQRSRQKIDDLEQQLEALTAQLDK